MPKSSLVRVPNVPSYESLLAENRRLKEQLGKSTIGLDLETGEVRVRNLRTPEFTVDALDVKVPQAPHLVESMVNLQSLLKNQGKLELPALDGLATSPMTVQQARVEVPEETANAALQQISGEVLRAQGVKDVHLDFEEGNRLTLTGTLDKLIDVPFHIEGSLAREGDSQVRFTLEKTKVLGFLPIPRLVTDIFTSLAARNLEEANVTQRGDDFLIDVGAFIPKNIGVGLRNVSTHEGFLLVEAGPPQDAGTGS